VLLQAPSLGVGGVGDTNPVRKIRNSGKSVIIVYFMGGRAGRGGHTDPVNKRHNSGPLEAAPKSSAEAMLPGAPVPPPWRIPHKARPPSNPPDGPPSTPPPGALQVSAIYGCGCNLCGCNLKLSEVRSGSCGVGLGLFGPQTGPKSNINDPDRTSDNLNLQPHELQPHP
jgi:hypothetical protein